MSKYLNKELASTDLKQEVENKKWNISLKKATAIIVAFYIASLLLPSFAEMVIGVFYFVAKNYKVKEIEIEFKKEEVEKK